MERPALDVIIPAYNEERAIGLVLRDIPRDWVREIVVANNGSTDGTASAAVAGGATVVDENRRGYGSACLRAMAYLRQKPEAEQPEIVVFLDGDYSDYPGDIPSLLQPVLEQGVDLVIGSRTLGLRERGSLTPQQRFGNWLATRLIRLLYGYRFSDLGPFRAIRWKSLLDLDMRDPDYGWTVEMQVKAAKKGLRCTEIPVRYRRRIGQSKVSGTLRGTVLAGYKILTTIFKNNPLAKR